MATFASFGKFYPFSIPHRVVFVSFQSPAQSRIHLFTARTPSSFFFRPVEPSFAFASRNTRMLNSQQLFTKIFLAHLFNNYYSSPKPREKFESSYTSEKTQPARPKTAEEKLNTETQARAFQLLKIKGNAPSDYAVLGVEENASTASVKKAFYSLAREFHPDKNKYKGSDDELAASEAFTLVSEAYARLTK